jgi:hypothetical protein
MDKWCILAAQEICNKWSVGESSRFCDDPPDFDLAESSDVAVVIWSEYQRAIAAQSGTQAATEAGSEQPAVQQAKTAIALLNEKLSFYDSLKPAHDCFDEYHDIMRRWRSAKAAIR